VLLQFWYANARTAREAENGPQIFGSSRKKNKMASVGSSRNGCATIGITQPSLCDMPTDFAWYATVEADS
jgi:hypothetical protein